MYQLLADQEFFIPCEYLVCETNNHEDTDLVLVYRKGDEQKFPIVAFQAKFIATGEHA